MPHRRDPSDPAKPDPTKPDPSYVAHSPRESLGRSLRWAAVACHLLGLLWIPLAGAIASLVLTSRLGQIAGMVLLAGVTEGGYSSTFILLSTVPLLAMLAQLITLSLPQLIYLQKRFSHPFVQHHGRSVVNWLLSACLILFVLLSAIAWGDRHWQLEPTEQGWLFSLIAVPTFLALVQGLMAIVAI
ncbi:MAG: hypothetical protein VKJ24_03095 [Synechococcales bacterium]|nr:hypothetical protein [Synechococcales bacterium]